MREEQHRQEEQVLMVLLSGFWGNSEGYIMKLRSLVAIRDVNLGPQDDHLVGAIDILGMTDFLSREAAKKSTKKSRQQ